MEKQLPSQTSRPTIKDFRKLASENQWEEYDRLARAASNDRTFLRWTKTALVSDDPHNKDLALTLLENTTSPIYEKRKAVVTQLRDTEENLHLRRKAAITLFRHGDKTSETIKTLKDAHLNDPELRDQVAILLGVEAS